MANERVRIEIGFDGGQVMGAFVETDAVEVEEVERLQRLSIALLSELDQAA